VPRTIIAALAGGGIGFAIGYFGRCTTGACPLTSNWYISTGLGALIGVMFALNSPGAAVSTGYQSPHVTALSQDSFWEEVKDSRLPVIVKFYSDHCAACSRFSPTFNELADAYAGRVRFFKADVAKAAAAAGQLGVKSIPALALFSDGHLAGAVVEGAQEKAAVEAMLDGLLAKTKSE